MKWLPTPLEIRITLGSPEQARTGLLAFASVRFDAFVVDGIAVRRTLGNRLELSYPGRHGGRFPHFLPTDPDWRRQFEAEVVLAYQREVGKP